MRLSPLDIYNKEFRQALNGYNRSEVDAFLEEVGRDYEALTRENIELKQQVEQMAKRLADYARREAETILEQARAQARQVEEDAARLRQQRERFLMEFETLLRSHLAALERETTAAR
jgi:cell division initiation protein